ncbi:SUN domain-containing protein 1-like [Ochotona curzoniae]|uniref:SUN domain-containing protein 1-like n=1 Tax=Ochotona curzoniae TaxID=130825 RepID=UPI001B34A6AE|nr:SUN domain-containing protein 1-like [Ochotona curzoniae]
MGQHELRRDMDFSRLHLYSPPQCVPDNTGYTYALSSSYSSDALDFETQHRLDPVFDSPRMSRRSLRLVRTSYSTGDSKAGDTHPSQDGVPRTLRQRRSAGKAAPSVSPVSRRAAGSQGGSRSVQAAAALQPCVLDESLIREQTEVTHFWGLDDDGDTKGAGKAVVQENGALAVEAAEATGHNGYTCSSCRLLSERRDTLTAQPTAYTLASRVYSRDRMQKRGACLYADRLLGLATCAMSSLSTLLVQLFQVVLLKLNYESDNFKLKSYESKDGESESFKSKSYESKAHAGCCGSVNVTECLRVDGRLGGRGESMCDDCKRKRHLETHTATHSQSSRPHRLAGTMGHLGARAGHFLVQTLRRVWAAGCHVSRTLWSILWLAAATPGRAASGMFWWLGIGWYQFVTLVSWLNVFLLTRCLRHLCRFLILLLPLLLLLGAGVTWWGQGGFLSPLPAFNWPDLHRSPKAEHPGDGLGPGAAPLNPPVQAGDTAFPWRWRSSMDQQVTALTGRCHTHDKQLQELTLELHKLHARLDQVDEGRAGLSSWVKDLIGQQLQEADFMTLHREHEVRLSALEGILGELAERAKAFQKELQEAKLAAASEEQQHLLASVKHLELELSSLRARVSDWPDSQSGCLEGDALQEKVQAQVRESVRLLFAEEQQDEALEQLLQSLAARFVSKEDLQAALQVLELRILTNVTQHMAVTKQAPTSEAVLAAVAEAGLTGITEARAQAIVNNALKLYSQDKTGLVDFALESGGGSVLSTRCSETYETKTALISLFGIPLWYFSQSPRVVIQPDIYPGNCWAFKGSQGYLVVRLSMPIWPTTFTLEHIPKALAPTGNIASAPKDFAVYGLESEYQEEGQLLGQFTYDQDGDSLQMFRVLPRPDKAFQMVELRILSNWGHPEYTCLYRFRVHGDPAE